MPPGNHFAEIEFIQPQTGSRLFFFPPGRYEQPRQQILRCNEWHPSWLQRSFAGMDLGQDKIFHCCYRRKRGGKKFFGEHFVGSYFSRHSFNLTSIFIFQLTVISSYSKTTRQIQSKLCKKIHTRWTEVRSPLILLGWGCNRADWNWRKSGRIPNQRWILQLCKLGQRKGCPKKPSRISYLWKVSTWGSLFVNSSPKVQHNNVRSLQLRSSSRAFWRHLFQILRPQLFKNSGFVAWPSHVAECWSELNVKFIGETALRGYLWKFHELSRVLSESDPYIQYLKREYRQVLEIPREQQVIALSPVHVDLFQIPLPNILSAQHLPIPEHIKQILGRSARFKGKGLNLNVDRIFVRFCVGNFDISSRFERKFWKQLLVSVLSLKSFTSSCHVVF